MRFNRLIFALAWTCAALAADRSPCEFTPYKQLRGMERHASEAEYESVVKDTRFTCEKLVYRSSGGITVVAFLYRPAIAAKRKPPLVIFNRGGYVVKDQLPLLVPMFHRLAEAGFTVAAPMYRGSEGAPGHDELGGADLDDLKNLLPVVKGLGVADMDNVFLYGESRGGVMTFLALRDGLRVRAATTFGAFSDLNAYLDADPHGRQALPIVWPDQKENAEQYQRTRSAIHWPERLRAPLLLMHGGADRQVSPLHTLKLATRLQELGSVYGMIVFAGDDHILSKNRVERDQQAIRWFQEHAK